MIKFDKDVSAALRILDKAGFETYAAGDCVRDAIRGEIVWDWDLYTRAKMEDLVKLLPDGVCAKDKNGEFLRMDFTYEVKPKDESEESFIEGSVLDVHPLEGSIEDFLAGRAFTVNALADNPERGFLDPYGGREDLKKHLIRAIGDPAKLFQEKPICMMEAVRLAAEMDCDLQQNIYDAIVSNWRLLLDYNIAEIRDELELLVVCEHAGKGLSMLAESGLMAVVLGEEIAGKMSMSDMNAFKILCKGIDKTKPVRTRRLGLLYATLSEKKGLAAIKRMQFDPKTKMHLDDAMTEVIKINFLNDEPSFKRYLCEHGLERYEYVHNLSKAQRIVFDHPSLKIESRNYKMKTIMAQNEPVFVEDLVIDANDIIAAGITDSPEKAEELLKLVVAVVHREPAKNEREVLLKAARKYARNKFAAKTRYIKWAR
ncbi:hypothetical protein ACPW7J_04105 [Ihubacter sp. rT4E-8]|uniref:hypothetical protein n=1 Tax=Ihubacter sp. rT4E-8 TaxID=3242369 RepID=UPI003CF944C0